MGDGITVAMQFDDASFQEHLAQEHKSTLFADYLKEIVYGGNDGIVTTFAVVAGFTGAYSNSAGVLQLSILTVLLFGLANLFADGTAMGLGSFLALRAEKTLYKKYKDKERREIKNNPDMERQETIYLFQKKGFSEKDALSLTDIISKNKSYWLYFMMNDELELSNPENTNEVLTGLMTFLSFCFFGFIPILPYLFLTDAQSAFIVSTIFTLLALCVLGAFSGFVSSRKYLIAILETVAVGSLAASVAFFVGTFFR